jgi:hypothetical protein
MYERFFLPAGGVDAVARSRRPAPTLGGASGPRGGTPSRTPRDRRAPAASPPPNAANLQEHPEGIMTVPPLYRCLIALNLVLTAALGLVLAVALHGGGTMTVPATVPTRSALSCAVPGFLSRSTGVSADRGLGPRPAAAVLGCRLLLL